MEKRKTNSPLTYDELKKFCVNGEFKKDISWCVNYGFTGWKVYYTDKKTGRLHIESISDDAMKVLRWFWKHIEANDN